MLGINTNEILETINMIRDEHLDIRTVTMGISLFDCVSENPEKLCENIYNKITNTAKNLIPVCETIEKEYGIPIINKRISLTPISLIGAGCNSDEFVKIAKTLDKAADTLGVNFIGGYSALVQKGFTNGARELINSIPQALTETSRICSSRCLFSIVLSMLAFTLFSYPE